ncbi:hypothetical protein [Polyangium sp. 15x6]|uniref:hypothetical protein n=1 Tax=Polyangium sp. 15x6 TaxID=3042687 RepID=UPI002499E8D0|nr:hypothetical protein [Polyangium sp. 15x6]MDI3291705.1 hypothetical protein [Polyangium sp. 15x6]
MDLHADGAIDFDFDGTPGEEGAADPFTPMQPYVERAFDARVTWVKDGTAPKPSGTVATDPKNDVLDAAMIDFRTPGPTRAGPRRSARDAPRQYASNGWEKGVSAVRAREWP